MIGEQGYSSGCCRRRSFFFWGGASRLLRTVSLRATTLSLPRVRFRMYRKIMKQQRLLRRPRGSVGRVGRERKDVDEEVSRQMSQKASGSERPPTPRPPASSADMKVARMVLNRKGPKAKTRPRRTLLDRLRLGSAQRAAKRALVQDPNLPSRATKIGTSGHQAKRCPR